MSSPPRKVVKKRVRHLKIKEMIASFQRKVMKNKKKFNLRADDDKFCLQIALKVQGSYLKNRNSARRIYQNKI